MKNNSDDFFINDFNLKVCKKLFELGYSIGDNLVLGVSGGADSISLLTSIVFGLDSILKSENAQKIRIYVLTINHNIRESSVSLGDCEFVKNYCDGLNEKFKNKINVACKIVSLKEGQVFELAKSRGRGIEDAARFFRYENFENFCYEEFFQKSVEKVSKNDDAQIEKDNVQCKSMQRAENEVVRSFEKRSIQNVSTKRLEAKKTFFALAHNQNDQIETLLMRFLQGAGTSSRCGILEKRVSNVFGNFEINFIRPLLDFPRDKIEKYLSILQIPFKTDSTNFDNSYLRNKIRNCLIPVLKENFLGFETALLSGAEKAKIENEFLQKSLDKNFDKCFEKIENSEKIASQNKNENKNENLKNQIQFEKNKNEIFIEEKYFYNLTKMERLNFLYKALDFFKVKERIPFSFLETIFNKEKFFCDDFFSKQIHKEKNGVEFFIYNEKLFIKKIQNEATTCGFSAIIEDDCILDFDFGTLFVTRQNSIYKNQQNCDFANLKFVTNQNENYFINDVKLPILFRSRALCDKVLTADKNLKSVSDVLSDFAIPEKNKNLIPVIESLEEKNIILIWGEIFGYKNWRL